MDNLVFFIQYKSMGSSSRGILSGGVVLSLEDLYDRDYMLKVCRGSYNIMYQKGRGRLSDLKSMRLSEFNNIFSPESVDGIKHLLGFDPAMTPVFRKEILDEYGVNAGIDAPKTTVGYRAGQIIESTDGFKYVYAGNVNSVTVSVNGRVEIECGGNLFIPVTWLDRKYGSLVTASAMDGVSIVGSFISSYVNNYRKLKRYFLKGKKKAVDVDGSMLGLNTSNLLGNNGNFEYNCVLPKNYYYGAREVKITGTYSIK